MFTLFRRKTASRATVEATAPRPLTGLLRPESAEALLASPRRQKLLEHIWQRTALSRAQFARLYRAPLERYASLVQQFPASQAHHHSYPGGMLDHGLEIVAYAVQLRQSYLLPVGAPPETQAGQAEAWTAASAYAALLHDIGKIAVDLHVEYADGTCWHPWHGPPTRPYRFRHRKDRAYRLHTAATGLLYANILQTSIMDWLSGVPELWASLLYVLAGQYEHAGILGELIVRADQASVAQDLGGDLAKVQQAPRQSLQRKLLDGLRYLVREKLKLNQPEASDGWLTEDGLWLVCKTVCDKLRAHLLSQGIDGVPSNNTVLFDVLQEHALVLATTAGKAIWTGTVASERGWTHDFSFLKVAPALIWEGDERPKPFRGTVRTRDGGDDMSSNMVAPAASANAARTSSGDVRTTDTRSVADEDKRRFAESRETVDASLASLDEITAMTQSTASPAPEAAIGVSPSRHDGQDALHPRPETANEMSPGAAPGTRFVEWLCSSIQTHRLVINDARALIHTVRGTAYLVSPGIFQRYAQEHPDLANTTRTDNMAPWAWVQKNFERLRLHKRHDDGTNIWTCEVIGPRKNRRVHGYLLIDGQTVFSDVPPDNPYLKLLPKKAASETAAA